MQKEPGRAHKSEQAILYLRIDIKTLTYIQQYTGLVLMRCDLTYYYCAAVETFEKKVSIRAVVVAIWLCENIIFRRIFKVAKW